MGPWVVIFHWLAAWRLRDLGDWHDHFVSQTLFFHGVSSEAAS
jgi:hypothetical protein